MQDAGLGFRRAEVSALPAFCFSPTAARSLVNSIGESLASTGLLLVSALMASFDARTAAAIERLTAGLSPEAAERFRELISDAENDVVAAWAHIAGDRLSPSSQVGPEGAPGGHLVAKVGAEDPEASGLNRGGTSGGIGL